MATRIYKTPFAATGDKESLATADQPDGKVSLQAGWTPDYELPNDNASYRPVGRAEMNGVLSEITESIGEMQLNGFAKWQIIDGGWPLNSMVVHSGVVYTSTDSVNTTEPGTPGARWEKSFLHSPQFTGTPTAPTPSAGDRSTRLATTAFVAGNFPMVYSINALPTQNVGPITVAECGEVWIWSSSAYFTGYRSPLCGRPLDGHTAAPLVSEVDAIGGDLNKAAYPGLWGYAQENGLVISDSAWIANRGAHFFVDTGPSTFRVPDLRNIFRRYTGINADTGGTRTFGSLMKEAMKDHLHAPSGGSQFAMLSSGGGAGFAGSGYTVNGVGQTGGIQGGGGSETRPINTAYYPRIHI